MDENRYPTDDLRWYLSVGSRRKKIEIFERDKSRERKKREDRKEEEEKEKENTVFRKRRFN